MKIERPKLSIKTIVKEMEMKVTTLKTEIAVYEYAIQALINNNKQDED